MLIFGVLLILISVAFAGLLARDNPGGPGYAPMILGYQLPALTVLEIFLCGILLGLVFCFGLWLVASAGRRRRALGARVREARQEARSAAAERDKLAEQLTRRHAAPGRSGGKTVPPTTGAPGGTTG
jgi:hypothetical protein